MKQEKVKKNSQLNLQKITHSLKYCIRTKVKDSINRCVSQNYNFEDIFLGTHPIEVHFNEKRYLLYNYNKELYTLVSNYLALFDIKSISYNAQIGLLIVDTEQGLIEFNF